MFYPIIERRISGNDRRQEPVDRRTTLSKVGVEQRKIDRRLLEDRRILQLDRKKLLESFQPHVEPPKAPRWLEMLRLGIMPLVVAIGTGGITYQISKSQTESAKKLSESQIESSLNIAKANRQSSIHIAEADLKTKNLGHIINLFTDIIDPSKHVNGENGKDSAHHRIRALEVYRDESLPFLLQLEKSYENKDKPTSIIVDTVKSSIHKILSQSQTDVTNKEFLGKEDNFLNIRLRNYANFNLSKSTFKWVNLYSSDFTNTTLIGAVFDTVDLVGANFSRANLKNVTFKKLDLKDVNFVRAKLKNTEFIDCKNIHKAKFSLKTLIFSNDAKYLDEINEDDFLKMLAPHKINLEEELNKNPEESKPTENNWRERLYTRVGITGIFEKWKRNKLIKKLEELNAKIPNENLEKYSENDPIVPTKISAR